MVRCVFRLSQHILLFPFFFASSVVFFDLVSLPVPPFFPFSVFQTVCSELEEWGVGSFLSSLRERGLFHSSMGICFCAAAGLPASLWLSRGHGMVLSWLEPGPRLRSAEAIIFINGPLGEQWFWFPELTPKSGLICHLPSAL